MYVSGVSMDKNGMCNNHGNLFIGSSEDLRVVVEFLQRELGGAKLFVGIGLGIALVLQKFFSYPLST
jgi:hypothetical protein